MSGKTAFFIELVLVYGGVLAWAIWELTSLRRSQARDRVQATERARHAEGQHGADQG